MESQERAACFNDRPNVSVLEKSHPETMQTVTARASRYLCVWFPNWPIQRLVVAQPELRQQPVVLFYRDPRRGQLVSACSPRASQAGLASQMPLAEAKSLAARDRRRSTGHSKTDESFGEQYAWHWQEHHPEHDLQRLEHLADRCQWFSPVVGLEHADQPSCLLLDVTGVARLFGGEATLARQMLRWLSHRGYWPKIAIADTLGVAWGMAHFGQPRWLEADDLEGEDLEGEEGHATGAPPSPAPTDKGLPHAASRSPARG